MNMSIENQTIKNWASKEYDDFVNVLNKDDLFDGNSEKEKIATFAYFYNNDKIDRDSDAFLAYNNLIDEFYHVTGGLRILIGSHYNRYKRCRDFFWTIDNFPYFFDSEEFKKIVKKVYNLIYGEL